MELISQCAIRVAKLVWRPGHGGFAYTVVCKATFELMPELSPLAAAQEAVVEADVYTGAQQGSLAQASELVPFKKRPEVLLTGHAHAPDGRPVTSLVARLVVGEIDKAVQVEGNRQFDADGWIGDPEPFVRMPLVWERAAGGPGTLNPAGLALNADARVDALGQVPAPNLLPPGLFLTSRKKVVPPVGFGPISPRWALRASHLHRHAARWDPDRWNQLPLPADVDVAYFNAAPPDQQRAEPFGEERIYLENLHPRFARLSTRLAPVSLAATVDQGSGPQPLRPRCDTLIIDADRGLAMLVWRAHVLLDHPERPGRVIVTGSGEPEPALQDRGRDVPEVTTTTLALSRPGPGPEALPFSRAMTVLPTQLGLPGPVLPFAGKAAPVDVTEEAEPSSTAPRAGVRMTIGLSHLGPSAPVLPFAEKAAPVEPEPEPEDDASATAPIADVSRTIGLSWLGPSAPAMPFAEKAAPVEPAPEEDDPSATMPIAGVSMTIGISHPGPPSPALPFARATTLDVSQIKAQSVDLPFTGAAAQTSAPPSSSVPRESAPRPAVPGDDETTMTGMVRAATLPFIGSRRESEATPLPFTPETSAPAPVFVLESAPSSPEAPETASELARMRAIQQAIGKGDRPTRQVLAEHGLTEIEWRAMKRASARRANA